MKIFNLAKHGSLQPAEPLVYNHIYQSAKFSSTSTIIAIAMSSPVDRKENTSPHGLRSTLWNVADADGASVADTPDIDECESPQGYTHPAYYSKGPFTIVKNTNPLGLEPDGTVNYTYEPMITPSYVVQPGRPPSHEGSYWPAELVNKYRSPMKYTSFMTPSELGIGNSDSGPMSDSPKSGKRPASGTDSGARKSTRPKIQRMGSSYSTESDSISVLVPNSLRHDTEVKAWCSEIAKSGPTIESIQFGLNLFAAKMGQPEPNTLVLNTFELYLNLTITRLIDVRAFFGQYHYHLLQKENEKLIAENAHLKSEMEKQEKDIKMFEEALKIGIGIK
ncbi:hypothetical protein H072_2408 [Dactylellina haptotyla CBS 200.50]|uniref:Uncharacterized protein n=1 Tax=Dactylellina haptotyla (strain CBS 200.50) TaxID=1284197 RepID=S8C755_DACHA|nr:hypothetical protein H072_2408 [Dactylellina haptotyla CBS 200.50]